MNTKLDRQYWEHRYQKGETAWDAGHITAPIKQYADQLADKSIRILIPGAGNAHEAEYLQRNGFTNTFVCDLAQAPLENLRKRCPDFPADHLLLADFFELTGQYDLVIEQTFFCALDPKLRRAYFEKVHQLLKPSGKLVGLLFDDILNEDFPPFGGSKAEYLGYFGDLFTTRVFETANNSIKPREGRELFMVLQKT